MTGQIYIKTPFALNGDTTLIPQTDGSGAVNFDDGYGIKYEQDPNGTGLALNRANMNYRVNVITQDLQQYQQHGIPNFITTSDNGGSPFLYDERALVLYDAGAGVKMYWSLVAANNALPSDPAKWIEINPYNVAQSLASPAFTGTPTAPTPPANDNTTRLATTAFVLGQVADGFANYKPYQAKCVFRTNNDNSVTVLNSYNIASVVRDSTGLYTVTFTNPITGGDYAVSLLGTAGIGGANGAIKAASADAAPALKTATQLQIVFGNGTSRIDIGQVNLLIF